MSSSLPTTTNLLRIQAKDSNINYSVASPNFNEEDIFKGAIYLTLSPDLSYFREKSRFYFWITYLPHSVLICDIDRNGNILRDVLSSSQHGIEIFVRLGKNRTHTFVGYVQALIPKDAVCTFCKSERHKYPELGVMWLAPGEDNKGYMFAGSAKFLLPFEKQLSENEVNIRNFPMELHLLTYKNFISGTPEQIVLGNITMDTNSTIVVPNDFEPMKKFVVCSSKFIIGGVTEGAMEDHKRRWGLYTYKRNFDKIIQQPYIASIFGIVPRAIYYMSLLSDCLKVSDKWIAAQLMFSFKLSNIPLATGIEKHLPSWNIIMHVIIRAFTMFVTRYNYIKDAIYKTDGEEISFECYSGSLLAGIGSYDCEDGAWLLTAIFRRIQNWNPINDDIGNQYQVVNQYIEYAKNMLNEYIICSALVTVTNPCLFQRTEEAKKNDQYGYHQTCLLIPKCQLIPQVQIGLNSNMVLNTLYAESTCLIYADPSTECYPIVNGYNSALDDLVSELQEGNEILALPVERNTGYNNAIYGRLLALYSDFDHYKDENINLKGKTEIQLHNSKGDGGTTIDRVNEIYKLEQQSFGLKGAEDYRILHMMESSSPMFDLDIDFDKFLEEYEKMPRLKGETAFSPIIGKQNNKNGRISIPYLGWELTNHHKIESGEYNIFISG